MPDEIAGSPLEIKEIAEKALLLQRLLLRRAWGALYATYAVSIFITIFGAPIVFLLGFGAGYTIAVRVGVGMLVSGAALTVTLLAFRRVKDTAEIRSLVTEGRWKRVLGYQVFVPLWVAAYVVFLLAIFVFGLRGDILVLVLSVYLAFWAFLYYAMNLSFPGKLPVEGIAALSSFGIASAGSLAAYFSVGITGVYLLLWSAMIVVWVVSAFYARTRPLPKTQEGAAV